jgi:hypothetical protein
MLRFSYRRGWRGPLTAVKRGFTGNAQKDSLDFMAGPAKGKTIVSSIGIEAR